MKIYHNTRNNKLKFQDTCILTLYSGLTGSCYDFTFRALFLNGTWCSAAAVFSEPHPHAKQDIIHETKTVKFYGVEMWLL